MEELNNREKIILTQIGRILDYQTDDGKKQIQFSNQKDELLDSDSELTDEESEKLKEIDEQMYKLREKEYDELYDLYNELDEIKKQKLALSPPSIVGDRIYLKKPDSELKGEYTIFKKDDDQYVGTIEYRGYHVSDYIGDIGVRIESNHRGNNYFYEALQLLSEVLLNNEIDSFWISANDYNIPSVKTIIKYGGEKIESPFKDIVILECKTRKYKDEKVTSKGGK